MDFQYGVLKLFLLEDDLNHDLAQIIHTYNIIYSARDPSSSSVHNDVTPESEPAVPVGTSICTNSAVGPSLTNS